MARRSLSAATARAVLVLLGALLASLLVAGSGALGRPVPTVPGLTFGIYPGGAAGTVGPAGPVAPEDPARRLAALERLRPAKRPLVLHLYVSYTGPNGPSAAQQIGEQVSEYGRAGFETEVALCYRPASGGSSSDVAGFVEFVRAAVRSLGHAHGFVAAQVTNEANIHGSPNASDGYYAGAQEALTRGVIAAKAQARAAHLTRVRIGFNWAYDTGAGEAAFWRGLGLHGGRRFLEALDWVGIDAYPGTWGPAMPKGPLATATARYMDDAFRELRRTYMPLARIPARVPLVVTENGFPTGSGRGEGSQAEVMRAAIKAAYASRRTYNVTGYRWFDLRDANSTSPSLEDHYGILRDDYTPKLAFGVYRSLVARLSGH
jgi:hypothetical protein